MMFRIRFWRFIEALFCQMVCLLITPLVYAVDYEVQLLLPPITDHVVLPTDPLPPVCSPLADMDLHGCRGQALPASFVITAAKPLRNVRVEAAQVRGEEHTWPATAVDIHVVKDYYRNTIASHMATMPTLLVHDESFLAIDPAPTKDYPDRMANVARGPLRDADSLQPVDISQRKQFWVTIHIPDKAKPGHYETTLRIVPQNSEATAFRLSIEVHPFELLPPMIEYSIYYPAYLEASLPADSPYNFGNLSAQQMLAEFRNMPRTRPGQPQHLRWPSRQGQRGPRFLKAGPDSRPARTGRASTASTVLDQPFDPQAVSTTNGRGTPTSQDTRGCHQCLGPGPRL